MQQIVPLTPQPNQTIAQTLTVDGKSLLLNLTFRYNNASGINSPSAVPLVPSYWVMTVADQDYLVLVDSVPMITGNDPACNILKQYSFLQIGSAFVLNQTGSNPPDYPDNTNLGTEFLLIWGDTP